MTPLELYHERLLKTEAAEKRMQVAIDFVKKHNKIPEFDADYREAKRELDAALELFVESVIQVCYL